VLHSSDTESADKVPAADVPAAKRLYNNLMQKINSLRPTTKVRIRKCHERESFWSYRHSLAKKLSRFF
jgi:hypothetical protein